MKQKSLILCFILALTLIIVVTPTTTADPYTYTQTTGVINGTYYSMWFPDDQTNVPLIIASPGIGGVLSNIPYDYFASRGYAVLGFNDSNYIIWEIAISHFHNNIQNLVEWTFNDDFPFSVNKSAVGLYGWSCGGGAVLSINDSRLKGIVANEPAYVKGFVASNNIPVLITSGTNDDVAPYSSNQAIYYNALNMPKMLIQVNAIHQSNAGIAYSEAWFEWLLRGNGTALDFINNVSSDVQVLFYQKNPYNIAYPLQTIDMFNGVPLSELSDICGVPLSLISHINGNPIT